MSSYRYRDYRYYFDARGRKWWYLFSSTDDLVDFGDNKYQLPSLLDEIPIQKLKNKVIISFQLPNPKTGNDTRYYTYYNNYVDFYESLTYIPIDRRCCYEKIIGSYLQKPHFDVDISLEEYPFINDEIFQEILDELITAIDTTLLEKGVEIDLFKDVLVFTSHNNKKKSCHVVIDHYVHSNNNEAKGFYQDVTNRMDSDYKQFIDDAVYKSTQDFRIMGNQKYGSNRIKTFQRKWNYRGNEIEFSFPDELYESNSDYSIILRDRSFGPYSTKLYSSNDNKYSLNEEIYLLKCSLVGWSEDCEILPFYEYNKKESSVGMDCINHIVIKSSFSDQGYTYKDVDMTREVILRSYFMTKEYFIKKKYGFPFEIGNIKKSKIDLMRKRPSYCPLCDRGHDTQNTFLWLTGNSYRIYYKCYQNSGGKLLIGYYDNKTIDSNPESIVDASRSINIPSSVTRVENSPNSVMQFENDIKQLNDYNNVTTNVKEVKKEKKVIKEEKVVDKKKDDEIISDEINDEKTNSEAKIKLNNIKIDKEISCSSNNDNSNNDNSKKYIKFDIEMLTSDKKMLNHYSEDIYEMNSFMGRI